MSHPSAIAPYAQAAAVVKADGTILRAHGIQQVIPKGSGNYWIKVDSTVRLDRSVPVATPSPGAPWGSGALIEVLSAEGMIRVLIQTINGGNNAPFHLVVP
ncbi:hypothetical protein ACFVYT_40580 [Streptomyces sp. NPDC058290]|uniref:hypothetical protein n=1 Tax=Streptomyces sp. NPDC058290 TaxID=3346426 RepID=UPI0036E3B2C3